jgi:hypothetical protein
MKGYSVYNPRRVRICLGTLGTFGSPHAPRSEALAVLAAVEEAATDDAALEVAELVTDEHRARRLPA